MNGDSVASVTRLSPLILREGAGLYCGFPLSEMAIARGTRPETRSVGHFPGPSNVEKTSPAWRTCAACFWVERAFRWLKKIEAKRFGGVDLFLRQSAYGDTIVDRDPDAATDSDNLAQRNLTVTMFCRRGVKLRVRDSHCDYQPVCGFRVFSSKQKSGLTNPSRCYCSISELVNIAFLRGNSFLASSPSDT